MPPPKTSYYYWNDTWTDDLLDLLDGLSGLFISPIEHLYLHSKPLPPRPESAPPPGARSRRRRKSGTAIEPFHRSQQYNDHAKVSTGADPAGQEYPASRSPSQTPPKHLAKQMDPTNFPDLTLPPENTSANLYEDRNPPPLTALRGQPPRAWRNQKVHAPSTPSSSEDEEPYIPTPSSATRAYLDKYQQGGPPPSTPSSTEGSSQEYDRSVQILDSVSSSPQYSYGPGRITDYVP